MGTLEDLDQPYWARLKNGTKLDEHLIALSKRPVADLSTSDLRQLIDRGVSLNVLVPVALARLQADSYANGGLYPGDLLEAMKTVSNAFWDDHSALRLAWFKILSQHPDPDQQA